jgi:hypothetical protein
MVYKLIRSFWVWVYDFIYNFKYTKKYLKKHKIILLESNIFVIENVISDSLCNELVELVNTSPLTFKDLSKDGKNNAECYEFSLSDHLQDNKYKNYDNLLVPIVYNCFDTVKKLRRDLKISMDCGYSLRKFYGKTHDHIDWIYEDKNESRVLTLIIFLNDNYEGGVFNFTSHNISYRLKKGSALLFPPYWTHPHNVTPVKNGHYRYTINTWALYKE